MGTEEVAHNQVKWVFDVRRAREKLGRIYPTPICAEFDQAA